MKKKNNGITLIALVITIIVLLILSGVALSLVAGNEGILSKAETAVTQTNIQAAREQAGLLITEVTAEYYQERYVNRVEGIENQSVMDYVKTKIGEGKATSNGDYYVTIKDGAVIVYLGNSASAVAQENKVTMGLIEEDGKIGWIGIVELPEGLKVGDTVTYSPNGTYNWKAEYASSDLAVDGTADVALATGTKVETGKTDMSITSWKVLSINEVTGQIELVPSKQSSKTVRLQGPQGYNNGVKLLNDACSDLYGDSSKGISARSISMKDIEGAMTAEALATAHSYNNGNATWGTQTKNPYTANKQYPTIYAKENLSVINGNKNSSGLGMSDQTALIGRADEGATDGKITTATSIQPYQTYWTKDNAFMQTAFKGNGYSLLIPSRTGTNFWVASRSVGTYSGYCYFGVSGIGSGDVGASSMCNSVSVGLSGSRALFPVVSLSSELLTGDSASGWVVE